MVVEFRETLNVKSETWVCHAADLQEGGDGVRFEAVWRGEKAQAFAVRYDGRVRAYLNRCAHVPIELDWSAGKFFDLTGLYLLCATHGAQYLPENGRCVGGPCKGRSLVALSVVERDGDVYLLSDGDAR